MRHRLGDPDRAVPARAVAVFAVGAYEAITLVGSWWASGLQRLVIGMVSALAGYPIAIVLGAR